MSNPQYYSKLVNDPANLSPIVDAYEYYMDQYEEGTKEANALMKRGQSLETASIKISGIVGYRYGQLQECEQILSFLENRETRLIGQKRRLYREHYNRELTDSMVEKYSTTDSEVLDLVEIRNMFALVRNKFLGLSKHLEYLHYQISNLTKLRQAGIDTSPFET